MKRSHNSRLLSCLGGLLLSFPLGAFGQTDLAVIIADDAGGSPENYQVYADSLAETLKLMSPAQLDEIFKGGTPSLASSSDSGGEDGTGEMAAAAAAPEDNEPEVNLSPEYEAALNNLLSAQAAVNEAAALLASAEAALQIVLEDESGLIGDDIFGNFLSELAIVGPAVRIARETLAEAKRAEAAAKAIFEEF